MARRRSSRRYSIDLLLLFLGLFLALGVPRLIDGYSAVQWTRHAAAQEPDPLGQRSRSLGRHAARTIEATAPLPWAREATRLALAFAERQQVTNRPASVALYEQVAQALERATETPGRGLGLGTYAEEARRRAQAAREPVVEEP